MQRPSSTGLSFLALLAILGCDRPTAQSQPTTPGTDTGSGDDTDTASPDDTGEIDEPPEVERLVFTPIELSDPIVNPKMGWLSYAFYPTEGTELVALSDYSTVVYSNYWWWRELEPDFDGDYRWDLVDTWISDWSAQGRQVAIGVHLTDPTSSPYCMELPDWLFAQVDGRWIDSFYGYPVTEACGWEFEPYYWDEVLIEEHAELLGALANERASRPEWQDGIAWIDVSSYGYWGEWHSEITWPSQTVHDDTLRTLLEQYVEAFPRNAADPLDLSMNAIDDEAVSRAYAIEDLGAHMVRRGMGYYTAVSDDERAFLADHADSSRVHGEFGSFTGGLWTGDFPDPTTTTEDAVNDALSQQASLLGWFVAEPLQTQTETHSGETLEDYFQKRAGYRLVPSEVAFPSAVAPGSSLLLEQVWYQKGVGGLRDRMYLGAWLVQGDERIALGVDENFDPSSWPAAEPYWEPSAGPYDASSRFTVPEEASAGVYTLEIAVVDGSGDPAVNLAIENKHSEDAFTWGRYALGEVEVHPLVELVPVPGASSSVTEAPTGTLRNDFTTWAGMHIRVGDEALRVTRVGRAYAEGDRRAHEVRILDVEADHEIVISTSVNMASGLGEGSGFRYGMANGILEAGREYYVLVYETLDGDAWLDYDTAVTTTDHLQALGGVWSLDLESFNVGAQPGAGYDPVDLVVEVVE